MNGVQTAGLGLVALVGWSALVFGMSRDKKDQVKKHAHDIKETVKEALPTSSSSVAATDKADAEPSSSPAAATDETGQQAAFNPETGEINWDCPCLGGMAHGPCGQEFRSAFSCFVYSEEEVKGVDCVDKFRAMQECFRRHPDVYGNDIDEDDEDDEFDLIQQAEAALRDDEPIEPKVAK
ncbi:Oxidoreductase [Microbotryomycetes sp. JL221]|nr:Oxidoreductase [Microbotryomycetes sp. JL221]